MNKLPSIVAFAMVCCGLSQSEVGIGKDRSTSPAAVREVARCRAIAEDAARLRCFDLAADQLQAAVAAHDVYVLDRGEVRQTRQALFGLPVPPEGIVGERVDDGNKIDQVAAAVVRANQDSVGNWTMTLDNGAVWQQTDGYALAHGPRRGDQIVIKRAALGSFKMTIAGQSAVRVRRIR